LHFHTGAPRDPAFRFEDHAVWVATNTTSGAATIRFRPDAGAVSATAWGPGADAVLDDAPGLIGADDDPSGFRSAHPAVGRLVRRHPGLRITRSGRVVEMLLRTAVGQVVAGKEAKRSWMRFSRALGEAAPGPIDLMLPPDPAAIASMPYHEFHPFGIERRRAEILRRIARHANRLQEAANMPVADAYRRIRGIPGVGAWTAAKTGLTALGDADAVPVGDYHLPNSVAWVLAGEERADDDRMLELLEPYAGHRGRVIRLIQAAGVHAPKRGPRAPLRRFESW
jgi:3-methyladenine DNA glycosylase/8-oxoguanine DNA glycosylase